MCGLSGFWEGRPAAPERLEREARAMSDALARRGPDDAGAWVDAEAGLALGHRRLSILDLSLEGRQPMATPDGRYVLAYNGEVYDYRELRAELEARGTRFRTATDTEVVLHALAAWGVERALERFVGMFAFALWDREERTLVLARDRLGIKPLYWGRSGGVLFFGSELKALRRHPAFRAELDRDALALFFRHNYVPAPASIYAGVEKLEPGTWLRCTGPEEVERHVYWDALAVAGAARRRQDVDPRAAREELAHLVREAVRARTVSDVPLGAFLSGGIDSSTVVAFLQEVSQRPARTFTIGFHEEGYDESSHARAVARHLGTEHHELVVTPAEARALIPEIPEHWDEPFADSSQIPTLAVSRFARSRVTVCLSGDGGDELFGGYPRYWHTLRLARWLRRVPAPLRRLAAGGLRAAPPALWESLARGSPRLRRAGLLPGWAAHRVRRLAESLATPAGGALYRSMVSHWKRPEELVLGAREPATRFTAGAAFAPDTPDPLERMLLLDTLTYLPDDILCKVDRASMACGLEARVPLLDHRVVEFVWTLPPALRVGREPGKRLLEDVLFERVPRALFERPKMGFGIPIAAWLRGPLREWGEALLDRRRLADEGILDPEPVRRAWEEHQSGRRSLGYYLWDVLVFQMWSERWLGAERQASFGASPAGVGVR